MIQSVSLGRELDNHAIISMIEKWATTAPHTTAVERAGTTSFTYRDLWHASGNLAQALESSNATCLAVEASDSIVSSVGLLAALRTGTDLCLIDPQLPFERQARILESVRPSLVLRDSQTRVSILESIPQIQLDELESEQVFAGKNTLRASRYFVFTSGSTAWPKGIIGNFSGVAHFVRWQGAAYKVRPGDRFGALTSPAFDVYLRDLLTPLMHGATIVMPPSNWLGAGLDVITWMTETGITLVHTVPALATTWLKGHSSSSGGSLRRTFFAGEPLSRTLVDQWRTVFPNSGVSNFYGPSETTLAAFYCDLEDVASAWPHDAAPVGQPIPGVHAYVLDENGRAVQSGESGQVAIWSPYRSHGYLDDTLNGERFVDMPELVDNRLDNVVYLTGDRAVETGSGLVLLGRIDDELKIDGVRVDPRSIAQEVLGQYDGAEECVVLVDRQRNNRLVAFIRAGSTTQSDLRSRLRCTLPPGQIPSRFVTLSEFPLTASGKVDRQALLNIASDTSRPELHTRPSDDTAELVICEVWSEALGVSVRADDDLYELGGSSLLAYEIAGTLSRRLHIRVTPADVLEQRTPERLADYLKASDAPLPARATSHTGARRDGRIPLAPSQRYLSQIYHGELSGSVLVFVRLDLDHAISKLDVIRCLTEQVARHEALRTAVIKTEDGLAQHVYPPSLDFDARGIVDEIVVEDSRANSVTVKAQLLAEGLDSDSNMMWRCRIVRTPDADGKTALLFAFHHMVCDGISARIIRDEIIAHFNGQPLSTPELSWSDYAEERLALEESSSVRKQGDYWRNYLGEVALPMALASHRPVTFEGRAVRITKVGAWRRDVANAAKAQGVTPFSLYCAAYLILCHALYRRDGVAVVMPVAGRSDSNQASAVGMFTNMVTIRHILRDDEQLDAMLAQVALDLLAAQRNADYSFDRVWKENVPYPASGRFPVSGALIGAMPIDRGSPSAIDGPRDGPLGRRVVFDLHAYCYEDVERLDLEIQYRNDVMSSRLSSQCLQAFADTIQSIAHRPASKVADLVSHIACSLDQGEDQWAMSTHSLLE